MEIDVIILIYLTFSEKKGSFSIENFISKKLIELNWRIVDG
jgi:hypothetical protein